MREQLGFEAALDAVVEARGPSAREPKCTVRHAQPDHLEREIIDPGACARTGLPGATSTPSHRGGALADDAYKHEIDVAEYTSRGSRGCRP